MKISFYSVVEGLTGNQNWGPVKFDEIFYQIKRLFLNWEILNILNQLEELVRTLIEFRRIAVALAFDELIEFFGCC